MPSDLVRFVGATALLILSVAACAETEQSATVTGDSTAPASLHPAQQVIADASDDLKHLLREERNRGDRDPDFVRRVVDEWLLPRLDFDHICSLMIGRPWQNAPPRPREEFKLAFKTMMIRRYGQGLSALDSWTLSFKPSAGVPINAPTSGPVAEGLHVQTRISDARGHAISASFHMVRNHKDARWRVIDVALEGISLLSNLRAVFGSIARDRGLESLTEILRRRNSPERPSAVEQRPNQ